MNGKKIILASSGIVLVVGTIIFLNNDNHQIHKKDEAKKNPHMELSLTPNAHSKDENNKTIQTKNENDVALSIEAEELDYVEENNAILTPELKARMQAIQQRRPDLDLNTNEVALAVAKENAWEESETIPQHLPLSPEEFLDGRQFIKFDTLKLETLMPGDSLKIDGVDGFGDYDAIIDRVVQHNPESISWYGHIDSRDGESYDINFTRGKFLTVGGINTPEGHYALQAHGDDGWVASSALLFKVDENHTDEMYPEED